MKVSRPVIRTPTQIGMKLLDKRRIAVADPITSWMSDPIMASSINSHRVILGA